MFYGIWWAKFSKSFRKLEKSYGAHYSENGMYARACCLRRAAVPFLGTTPGGTSRTRSLANRRPSARIDYGFFVGTSSQEGERGSNLKDLTSFPFPQFPPKTLVIVH